MEFWGPLIVVENMEISRDFYESVLNQRVRYDFGENIEFEGGFSIHLKTHFSGILNIPAAQITQKANNAELYFEEDDLEGFLTSIENLNIEFVHPLMEQPWGQRVVRFYDPDFHIIEVGENMKSVAIRFLKAGCSAEETAKKTSMPLEFVKECAKEC